MKYEVTLRMTFKSSSDAYRIAKQAKSVFEFGTLSETIAAGLKLNEDPQLVSWLKAERLPAGGRQIEVAM